MIWLLLVPLWCIALVGLVALCRAAHLEDVALGYADDVLPLPAGVVVVPSPRREALPLAR
jgi:hypothetical protein